MYNEELYHHGILGMKWGVRRFQNLDGTLTDAGKNRMRETSESSLKSKSDTNRAKWISKTNAKLYGRSAVNSARDAKKYSEKAEKAKERYDVAKQKKYEEKAKRMSEYAEKYSKAADKASKFYDDIETGKVKAGKDFITQIDLNISLTNFPLYAAVARDAKNPNPDYSTRRIPYTGWAEYNIIHNPDSKKTK